MKKALFLSVAAIIVLMLSVCTREPVDNTTPEGGTTPGYVGVWHWKFSPFGTIITDTLHIFLNIMEDAAYSLKLNQSNQKILFSSEGTWTATGDSIFLNGSDCLILDTVPDPDTLAPLDDSLCGRTIALGLPESETEWTIQTANFTVMLSAFPIDPQFVNALPTLIPTLTLIKEE